MERLAARLSRNPALAGRTIRDRAYLYANVAGTALVAGELGDQVKRMGLGARDESVAKLARLRPRPDGPPILEIQPQD